MSWTTHEILKKCRNCFSAALYSSSSYSTWTDKIVATTWHAAINHYQASSFWWHTHTYIFVALFLIRFLLSWYISSNKTWLIDTCWPFICFLMIYHVSRRVYCDFFPLKTSINIAYLIHQNCFQCQILCIYGMLRTC